MKYLATGLLLAIASACQAADPGHTAPPAGASIKAPRAPVYTPSRTVERLVASRQMGDYRIMIAKPAGPPPAEGYPVVYVLDGDDYFAPGTDLANHLLADARGALTPAVIVGIGYPDDSRRSYDYLPPSPVSADIERTAEGKPMIDDTYGGADKFLDFVENELKPMIEKNYRIDRTRQALFGHSYGGLLAVHALFTRAQMFQTYLISSPSLAWNGRYVLSEEPGFAGVLRAQPHKITVRVTVGEYEQAMSPEQLRAPDAAERAARSARRRSVDNDRELSQRLNQLDPARLSSSFKVFAGHVHGTVALPAFAHGVPAAMAAQH